MIPALLTLINIGSSIAFNNITSLGVAALLSSYIVSISCLALRRIRNEALLPAPFQLSRITGLAVNITSILFLLVAYIFCFFPPIKLPPPPEAGMTWQMSMNWSAVVYLGVIVMALVYYVAKGRKVYDGPVAYVKRSV
jgi:choline transport protein